MSNEGAFAVTRSGHTVPGSSSTAALRPKKRRLSDNATEGSSSKRAGKRRIVEDTTADEVDEQNVRNQLEFEVDELDPDPDAEVDQLDADEYHNESLDGQALMLDSVLDSVLNRVDATTRLSKTSSTYTSNAVAGPSSLAVDINNSDTPDRGHSLEVSTSQISTSDIAPHPSRPQKTVVAQPELLSEYTCPICFSPPTNATLIPCGHVCCGSCLFMAVKSSIKRGAYMAGDASMAR